MLITSNNNFAPNNADPDKYKYSDHGIGFDSRSQSSWTDNSKGKILLFSELT